MKRVARVILILVLIPLYLIFFTVVHEVGHTVFARLFGDPSSTFYLVRIDPGGEGACLGCNITDHTRLSYVGNVVVSLGGLIFTQALAVLSLILLMRTPRNTAQFRALAWIGLGFAFLDVPVQVVQGLLYDITRHTWPTNVDLMDFMLLISGSTGASQAVLKPILAILAIAYLYWILRFYRSA
jgi:hypothetical protein